MQQEEPSLYRSGGGTATAEAPRPTVAAAPPAKQPPAGGSVSWTASEYIDHDRNLGWYLLLSLATIGLAALIYLITRDILSIIIIIILGFVLGGIAGRKPRQITYELNESGLKIGSKIYRYGTFKSFSVVHEDTIPSINLQPLRRFMPPISIYFAPQDEEQISSALSAHLPYHDQHLDGLERLSRRLRF